MLFQSLLLASTASATCLHGLSKFKRAEGEVVVGTFGYTGLKSPLNWASLDEGNLACKSGRNQSPINIDDTIALATEAPTVDIPEQAVEFENLGTTIEVIVNGTTSFAGTDFRLKQFHVHTPSEHRLGDEYFPLELHFVHEGVTNASNLAVISALFQLSTQGSDPLLSGLAPSLSAIATPGTKTEIESLDFSSLVEHVQSTPLHQYTGSLTTPPCAEGLTFLITAQPLPIDVDTFNQIKSIVKFNSRYTQNALGEANMIEVAMVSGTETQMAPPAEEAQGGASQEGQAGQPEKGATVVISEIQGTPLATPVSGVVVKKN
ncbi:carbonic anhydrase [Lophiostoma macrostomum CBS 122681]|uniref:Carbonic anhydrase n=1 Tax=Lophiostoma macrostomum CBS 122681 TaxID=1314788 RepID=A0A6A6T5W0_9PLEO|nr:carbonic anhydrase [Lophiostoma macrostomum CBS 122681]